MQLRTITNLFPAIREDIADLQTWRALPTPSIDQLDPFLFLNHHGWQRYPSNNHGLPFGPHPHRGFETVTFILEGDIAHRDSGGHESVIEAGGVQWMTAGRGLVHSETSSAHFRQQGGPLEVLQLWVNLPARLKMTEPRYVGLQREQIPVIEESGAHVQLISGQWRDQVGPIVPLVDIATMTVSLQKGATFDIDIATDRTVFFYVIRGQLHVNQRDVSARHLVQFSDDAERIHLQAEQDSIVLLCHGRPFDEPIVSYGPFVMNTREEIQQAVTDYQAGKFGN